jgi:hypothetical protein
MNSKNLTDSSEKLKYLKKKLMRLSGIGQILEKNKEKQFLEKSHFCFFFIEKRI